MIAVLMPCLLLCNACARAERARKLCSATLMSNCLIKSSFLIINIVPGCSVPKYSIPVAYRVFHIRVRTKSRSHDFAASKGVLCALVCDHTRKQCGGLPLTTL